jgi:hypothetical protein
MRCTTDEQANGARRWENVLTVVWRYHQHASGIRVNVGERGAKGDVSSCYAFCTSRNVMITTE